MARPQQQSIVRAGSGNKGTLSWLQGLGLIASTSNQALITPNQDYNRFL